MSCCTSGLADVFTDDVSRKDANRYRKRGLPPRARKLVQAIQSITSLENMDSLEVGVGAGAVTVEMLRRGARHATGVDAVPAQLVNARALAAEFHVANRAEFVLGDFTNADVADADVVILDRVVCCYPEWQPLLARAAAHARAVVALTYPRDVWWMHAAEGTHNLFRRLTRNDFRFHIHPPAAMHSLLAARGFTPRIAGHYWGWEIVVARRD